VQAELTRRKLLEAAVEHFSTRHFDDVATSDITGTAGVAQGLLFHYFGNKRGVYLEALRDAADKLNAAATPPSSDESPGKQFRQMLRAHLEYLSEHDDLALRLVLGGSGGDPEAWQIFDQSRWHTIEWTCQLLELDLARPALRLMLRSCAGALDEATTYWLKNERPFELDALVEVVVELLITSADRRRQRRREIDRSRCMSTQAASVSAAATAIDHTSSVRPVSRSTGISSTPNRPDRTGAAARSANGVATSPAAHHGVAAVSASVNTAASASSPW
jgi:AcrR family transcriptional regulator